MGRSERLIKLGNSWFSPKDIDVSRRISTAGGRALKGLGGLTAYQTLSNSEYRQVTFGRQAAGDKFRRQKGKSPDFQLRPPNPR